MTYVDTNGVEKNATDADFAATGYAVESLTGKTIVVKSDEKYVGSKINVTAASSRYDLIGTAELTVAEGASAINFATDAIAVNVNNKVVWNIVDANGNKVALGDNKAVSIDEVKYIVTSKPEGAKVSTYDAVSYTHLAGEDEAKVSAEAAIKVTAEQIAVYESAKALADKDATVAAWEAVETAKKDVTQKQLSDFAAAQALSPITGDDADRARCV